MNGIWNEMGRIAFFNKFVWTKAYVLPHFFIILRFLISNYID